MGTTTTYTTTVRIPVYAGWKCSYCNEKNFSSGNFDCKSSVTTRALRNSKLKAAKNEAHETAQKEWKQNTFHFIYNIQDYPEILRTDLHKGD